MVLRKHFNMREWYKILNDTSENGLEGPTVWSEATHQWNKIPTYTPHAIVGVYNYANLPGPMNVRFVVETTWNVELSERAPYNTSSVSTFPLSTPKMDFGEGEELDDDFRAPSY